MARYIIVILLCALVGFFVFARLPMPHRPHCLAYDLHHAQSVHFNSINKAGGVWSDDGAPALLAMIKNTNTFGVRRPLLRPDYSVKIFLAEDADDYPRYFYYISATGTLGAENEWCTVSPALRSFLISVKANDKSPRRPTYHPTVTTSPKLITVH